MVSRIAVALLVLKSAPTWTGCAGDLPEKPVGPAAPSLDSGPVLALVGGAQLRLGDVDALALCEAELRRQEDLPEFEAAKFEHRLERAIEILALAQEAERLLPPSGDIEEQAKRLLARVYLDRFMARVARRPVSEEELRRAHQEEMRSYQTTGESDLYHPTFIDAAAIVVGCFPDLHPPEPGERGVLTREEARRLAGEIAEACGGRVDDLDDFLARGRRFMAGRPSVDILEFNRTPKDFRLNRLQPELHAAIVSLADNGAVAPPLEPTPCAFYVVRRGVTYPGRGERMEEIREELAARVLLARQREELSRYLRLLRERYRAQLWPERLAGGASPRGGGP